MKSRIDKGVAGRSISSDAVLQLGCCSQEGESPYRYAFPSLLGWLIRRSYPAIGASRKAGHTVLERMLPLCVPNTAHRIWKAVGQ